jgi:DNA-binding XRE family transcriptional regulator
MFFNKVGMNAYVSKGYFPLIWSMGAINEKKALQDFGKTVRVCRKEQSMTQSALAYEMDVEISQISRIERGLTNPTLLTIVRLASGLRVSISRLFAYA